MASTYREKRIRFLLFLAAGILHGVLLIFVTFPIGSKEPAGEESKAVVIRVTDIQEDVRLPPPPIQRERPPETASNTIEAVAETMVETEDVPEEVVYAGVLVPVHEETAQEEEIEYLPMGRISVLPVLPEDQIRRAIVYPPIALRSGIEGTVY